MTYQMQSSDMPASSHSNDTMTLVPAATTSVMRPGQRPLVFSGSVLAMAMSFTSEIPYWYEVNVFRTEDQKFALVVKLFFQSEEESDRANGWIFDTLPEVFDALEAYDAAKDVRFAMPDMTTATPAEMAAEGLAMKARVEAQRAHFASLVGEFFAELDAAGQSVA